MVRAVSVPCAAAPSMVVPVPPSMPVFSERFEVTSSSPAVLNVPPGMVRRCRLELAWVAVLVVLSVSEALPWTYGAMIVAPAPVTLPATLLPLPS